MTCVLIGSLQEQRWWLLLPLFLVDAYNMKLYIYIIYIISEKVSSFWRLWKRISTLCLHTSRLPWLFRISSALQEVAANILLESQEANGGSYRIEVLSYSTLSRGSHQTMVSTRPFSAISGHHLSSVINLRFWDAPVSGACWLSAASTCPVEVWVKLLSERWSCWSWCHQIPLSLFPDVGKTIIGSQSIRLRLWRPLPPAFSGPQLNETLGSRISKSWKDSLHLRVRFPCSKKNNKLTGDAGKMQVAIGFQCFGLPESSVGRPSCQRSCFPNRAGWACSVHYHEWPTGN